MQLKVAQRQTEAAEKAAAAFHMGEGASLSESGAQEAIQKVQEAHKTIARLVGEVWSDLTSSEVSLLSAFHHHADRGRQACMARFERLDSKKMLHQAQSSVAAQVEAEWRAQAAEEGLRRAQGDLIGKEAFLSAAELQAAGLHRPLSISQMCQCNELT